MFGFIAETIGRMTKDVVVLVEETMDDIASIGDRFDNGYDKGMISGENQPRESKTLPTPTPTVTQDAVS